MDTTALDAALLEAHKKGDSNTLVSLYRLAADRAEADDDTDAACFYLTHAFVFALEMGHADTALLNRRLVDHGRSNLIPE